MGFMNKYMRCPYEDCFGNRFEPGSGNKIPKNIGLYKVKELDNNVLVFQCQRCLRSFRVCMRGGPLLWEDMTLSEQRSFKLKNWIRVKIKKTNEGKKICQAKIVKQNNS